MEGSKKGRQVWYKFTIVVDESQKDFNWETLQGTGACFSALIFPSVGCRPEEEIL